MKVVDLMYADGEVDTTPALAPGSAFREAGGALDIAKVIGDWKCLDSRETDPSDRKSQSESCTFPSALLTKGNHPVIETGSYTLNTTEIITFDDTVKST